MKRNFWIIYLLLVTLIGCTHKGTQYGESQEPETPIQNQVEKNKEETKTKVQMEDPNTSEEEYFFQLIQLIAQGDAAQLAGMIHYPIRRPYPFPYIQDSTQMTGYFEMMADDSLRKVCRQIKQEDITKIGPGYTFLNGVYLWNNDYGYLSINYQSKMEKEIMASLFKQEIESLHVSFRTDDMEPVACLEDLDSGAIYHLDKFTHGDKELYKLLVFLDKEDLSNGPDRIMDVEEDRQGLGVWYIKAHYQEDYIETALNSSLEEEKDKATVRLNGKEEVHRVKPIFWLDLIDKNIRQSLF